jgi:diacylglycerol kinase family enzyme
VYEVLKVEDPGRLQDIAAEAVERAQRNSGIVVAAGGDGTLNAVAQIALESDSKFGVIPQGTFNYFGRTHGISSDAAEAARGLLSARVQPVQVGLVNGNVFLVNASLGLYPKSLEDRE